MLGVMSVMIVVEFFIYFTGYSEENHKVNCYTRGAENHFLPVVILLTLHLVTLLDPLLIIPVIHLSPPPIILLHLLVPLLLLLVMCLVTFLVMFLVTLGQNLFLVQYVNMRLGMY